MGNACARPKADDDGARATSRRDARATKTDASESASRRDDRRAATTVRARASIDGGRRTSREFAALVSVARSWRGAETFATKDGFFDSLEPWWGVAAPTPWTGPPTPTMACELEEEEFYDHVELKRTHGKIPLYPWEGETWTGPRILDVVEHGLTCADVDAGLGRPCTLKMSNERQIQHLRNAIADVMQSVAFEFAMKVFEGHDTPPEVACQRFLRRLCEACHGGVYCRLRIVHKTKDACLANLQDSKNLGAALYTRIFMLRFLKRFPPQHGFRHREIDADETKERAVRDLADTFDMFKIWPASESHPAALFCCMTTAGMKNLLRAEVTDSWYGVNQMYEVALAQPSEYLSGKLPPMIVDVKKCSVTVFTRANIALIARQFAVAEFHPEPFAHFIVTNCPYLLAALWSIGKLFLTESARNKFVICTGDASTEIQKRYGVAKRVQPVECGGEARDEMIAARDWLAVVPHEGAIKDLQRAMAGRRAIAGTASDPDASPLVRKFSALNMTPKMAFKTGIRPSSTSLVSVAIRAVEFVFLLALFALVFRSPARRLYMVAMNT